MRPVWEFLKLEHVDKKKLFVIWLPLLSAVTIIIGGLLIVIPLVDSLFGKRIYTEHWTLFMLIVVSAILVMIGTLVYLFDVVRMMKKFNDDTADDSAKKISDRKVFAFLLLNFLTTVCALFLIWLSFSTMFGEEKDFDYLCQMNECLNLTIFFLFVVADYFLITIVRAELTTQADNDDLTQVERAMYDAFTLIDLPGLIGVLVIFMLSTAFQHTLNDGFAHSFAVGALTFHLIFTQFIVAYLRTAALPNVTGNRETGADDALAG